MDFSSVLYFLNHAAQSEVAQFGVAFSLAAYIHAGQVKKEIRFQMEGIGTAIDNVAKVLRADLDKQTENVKQLASRVEALEHK